MSRDGIPGILNMIQGGYCRDLGEDPPPVTGTVGARTRADRDKNSPRDETKTPRKLGDPGLLISRMSTLSPCLPPLASGLPHLNHVLRKSLGCNDSALFHSRPSLNSPPTCAYGRRDACHSRRTDAASRCDISLRPRCQGEKAAILRLAIPFHSGSSFWKAFPGCWVL